MNLTPDKRAKRLCAGAVRESGAIQKDATAEPATPVAPDANATPVLLDQREASPWGTNASTPSRSPSSFWITPLRGLLQRKVAGARLSPRWFLSTSLRELLQSKVAGARLSRPREVRAPRPSRSTRTRRLLYRAHSRRGLRPTHAPRPPPLLHDGARVRHGVRRGPRPGFAPALDILRVTGNLAAADATRAKHKLTRIVQMLVGLRRSR